MMQCFLAYTDGVARALQSIAKGVPVKNLNLLSCALNRTRALVFLFAVTSSLFTLSSANASSNVFAKINQPPAKVFSPSQAFADLGPSPGDVLVPPFP